MEPKGKLRIEESGDNFDLLRNIDSGPSTILQFFYRPNSDERALLDDIVARHNAFELDGLVKTLAGALELWKKAIEGSETKTKYLGSAMLFGEAIEKSKEALAEYRKAVEK